MSWLSYRAFLVCLLATAAATYRDVTTSNFSIHALVFWVTTSVMGGVFWGSIITWGMKKFGQKDR